MGIIKPGLVVLIGVLLQDLAGGAFLFLGDVDVFEHLVALHGAFVFVLGCTVVLLESIAIQHLILNGIEDVGIDLYFIEHD